MARLVHLIEAAETRGKGTPDEPYYSASVYYTFEGIKVVETPKPEVIIVSEFNRVAVECYRSCRNKISGYCTAEKITIDSFGMCNNFEEV